MSIEKPEIFPQVENKSQYEFAAEAGRELSIRKIEQISLEKRRSEINDIFSLIKNLDKEDPDNIQEVSSRVVKFIKSDPLSDQQAGVVSRSIEKLFVLADQKNNNPNLIFTDEEIQEILTGDWESIKRIFGNSKERASIWKESMGKMSEGKNETTVYRAMRLSNDELENIRHFGIISSGLSRFNSLEELVKEQILYFGGNNDISYLMRRIHFSKTTALMGTWSAGEYHEPFRLGISATTKENLKQKKSFFASTIVEIKIPQSALVSGPVSEKGSWASGEDEKTILYYVDPANIVGIYKTEKSDKNLWQQIEKKKIMDN